MASVETQPATLLVLPGRQTLKTKASKGKTTAASAKRMVKVSMACKKFSNANLLNYLSYPGRWFYNVCTHLK